jgi:hypothetical protein
MLLPQQCEFPVKPIKCFPQLADLWLHDLDHNVLVLVRFPAVREQT